jgi:hypothetical protein
MKLFVGELWWDLKIKFLTQANFVYDSFSSREHCNFTYPVYKDIYLKINKQQKLSLELDIKLLPSLIMLQ